MSGGCSPSDYAGMDRVWRRWFPDRPPARCVIPYMGLGTKGSRVEIAFVLLAGNPKLVIETVGVTPTRLSPSATNRRR